MLQPVEKMKSAELKARYRVRCGWLVGRDELGAEAELADSSCSAPYRSPNDEDVETVFGRVLKLTLDWNIVGLRPGAVEAGRKFVELTPR